MPMWKRGPPFCTVDFKGASLQKVKPQPWGVIYYAYVYTDKASFFRRRRVSLLFASFVCFVLLLFWGAGGGSVCCAQVSAHPKSRRLDLSGPGVPGTSASSLGRSRKTKRSQPHGETEELLLLKQ